MKSEMYHLFGIVAVDIVLMTMHRIRRGEKEWMILTIRA